MPEVDPLAAEGEEPVVVGGDDHHPFAVHQPGQQTESAQPLDGIKS